MSGTASAAVVAAAITAAPSPATGATPGVTPVQRQWGVVVSIQTGPPPTLTITLGGSSVSTAGVAYVSGYQPVVGDTVMVDHVGTDLLVTGKQAATLGASAIPTGVMLPFAGTAAPAGYLLCDGSSVSATTYAALFAIIGTAFGGGGGSFNLPNTAGRMLLGVGNSGTAGATTHTLGQTGGEETHTLTTTEMPSHTHTEGAHYHTFSYHDPNVSGPVGVDNSPASYFMGGVATNGSTDSGNGAGTGSTGNDGAHNNLPPYVGVNFIIKT